MSAVMDGPAVGVAVEFEEGVFGFAGAEVVVAHVRGEEGAAVEVRDEAEVDGVADAVRDDLLVWSRRGPWRRCWRG